MNVLSLFNGMSFGAMALETAGIEVDKYYSSEIDKYANQATKALYPDVIQLGDVTKWREWDVDWASIDLLLAGFPCQAWSVAGKQKGDNDPRGALVHDLIDIWNEISKHNPGMKFMFENVRMKKQFLDYINNLFGVEPVCINSALVSAQNRVRYYWTNIDYIKQPEDKGIMLADIIEEGIVDRDKSFCIDANYWKGTNVEQYIKKSRRQIVFMHQTPRGNNPGGARAMNGKTPCMSANAWEHNNHLVAAFTERRTEEAKRIRKEFMQKYGRDFSPRRAKELVARDDGKMNCLTATYSLKEHTLIDEKLYYRKLTPRECGRLQTVPEHKIDVLLSSGVSNSQLYKMLGNGWTHDVIVHIFKGLKT